MATIRDSSRRISNRFLVSETMPLCTYCLSDLSLPADGFFLSGCYFTGDGAHRSEDGYYQITGRMDDVINVSGHRLGTAEIEDALVRKNPHDIIIFITLSVARKLASERLWILETISRTITEGKELRSHDRDVTRGRRLQTGTSFLNRK